MKKKQNNSIYNSNDIFVLDNKKLEYLKKKAYNSKLKRFRYCLHHSDNHLTHEMIIVFHVDTLITPHRHPLGRSESYHVIEGSMNVYFFNDNGEVINAIKLAEKRGDNSFFYRLSSHTWHLPVPTSEYIVYHETLTGPFVNKQDIEYPKWKNKFNNKNKIKALLQNTKIIKNK